MSVEYWNSGNKWLSDAKASVGNYDVKEKSGERLLV